jgi:hypothetical protein
LDRAAYAKQAIRNKLIDHKEFIAQYGDDMRDYRLEVGPEAASGGSFDGGRQRLTREANVNVLDAGAKYVRARSLQPDAAGSGDL